MNVLFVTDEYPPRTRGGAGTYAEHITKMKDTNIDIFCPNNPDTISYSCKISGLREFVHAFFLNYHASKKKYDLVHTNGFSGYSYLGKKPLVATIHYLIEDNNLRSFFLRRKQGITLRRADKVVVPSLHVKRKLLDYFGDKYEEKIEVIHNGVEQGLIKEHRGYSKENLLMPSGLREPRKRIDFAIDVAQKSRHIEMITVTGKVDEDYKKEIIELAEQKGVKIDIKGFVERKELFEIYKKSFCTAIPSSKEGFPLVMLESMALGTPVIGRSGPVKEVMARENFICHGETPEEWVQIIEEVKEEYKDYSTESNNIAQNYTWEENRRKLGKVYERTAKIRANDGSQAE
jgi:glycosyltransferase involved in cell wall biosynthesis